MHEPCLYENWLARMPVAGGSGEDKRLWRECDGLMLEVDVANAGRLFSSHSGWYVCEMSEREYF